MKEAEADILEKCMKQENDYVLLNIEVKPGSKNTEIKGVDNWRDCIEVAVKERAQRGSANRELVQFLSSLFSLPQGQVIIVKGERTKKKSIRISGLKKNQILMVLKNEIEKE